MQTAAPTQVSADTSDLTAVIPQFTTLTIAGEAVEIRQFKVGRLPQVLAAVQPVAHLLMNREPGAKLDLSSLFMLYADDCLQLLSVLAGKPRAWVDGLELDEAITLLAALLEVNVDFFVQRVLPHLTGAVQKLTQAAQGNASLAAALGRTASNA